MPRCTMSSSPPSKPSRMNLPRRSTLITLWPTSRLRKISAGGVRSTSARITSTSSKRRPSTAPRRSRATVSTSGSSGTGNRSHLPPVIADLDVNIEGHAQLGGGTHGLMQKWHQAVDLLHGRCQQQLVVHLKQHPRPQASLANGFVHQ